jgi:hypothetical protein
VGFAIPAPSIFKVLSQYDDPKALHDHLTSRWSSPPSPSLPTIPPQSAALTPIQSSWLTSIRTAANADQLADALLSTPANTPSADLHSSWKQLLNPYSTRLSSTKSPQGKRHVLRLTFNSALVTQAVRLHLSRYAAVADGISDINSLPTPIRGWSQDATRDGVSLATIKVAPYYPRYESTRTVGWKCGPDHPTASSPYDANVDFGQLYGNTSLLMSFLHTAAPNCHPSSPTTQPDGTGIIDFIHEKRHRHELYRLPSSTSPAHGIHRPLRLKFYQRQVPTAQCCSLCGQPGHRAHTCTVVSPSPSSSSSSSLRDTSTMDVSDLEAYRDALNERAVCRDCYSPDHRESCYTPADQQHCKICKVTGHTSFRCSQYRPSWVLLPAPKPEDCRPLNLRPLTIIAQQQGRPIPSWSSIASGGRPCPSSHPSPNPSDYAPQSSDFPPLPNTGASSPPPSSTTLTVPPSLTSSYPHSSTTSEAAALRAEVKELRALLCEREASFHQLITQAVTTAITMALPLLLAQLRDPPSTTTPTPPSDLPAKFSSWPLSYPAPLSNPHHQQSPELVFMEESKLNIPHPTTATPPTPSSLAPHIQYGGNSYCNHLPGVTSLLNATQNNTCSPPHCQPPSLPPYSTATATSPPSHQ